MNEIKISVHDPTTRGRLIYHPDPQVEKHLLFISSPERRPRTYTLNVNGGQMIFGIAENFIIQSIEFNIPRKAWRVMPGREPPRVVRSASLLIIGINERLTQVEWPKGTVVVKTDDAYSYALIELGHAPQQGMWISLSEQVSALVMGDSLKGFFVSLEK
jgi:hypothetical protein